MRSHREIGRAMRSVGWDKKKMKKSKEWGAGQHNTWYFKG